MVPGILASPCFLMFGSGLMRSSDLWLDSSDFLSADWNVVPFSDKVADCRSYVDSVSFPFCANDPTRIQLLTFAYSPPFLWMVCCVVCSQMPIPEATTCNIILTFF